MIACLSIFLRLSCLFAPKPPVLLSSSWLSVSEYGAHGVARFKWLPRQVYIYIILLDSVSLYNLYQIFSSPHAYP